MSVQKNITENKTRKKYRTNVSIVTYKIIKSNRKDIGCGALAFNIKRIKLLI